MPTIGAAAGQEGRRPGEDQRKDVGRIVPGIRQEGEGAGGKADPRLDRDKARIEDNPDGEGATEVGGGVVMPMPPMPPMPPPGPI
jgi:hypothetical protein